MLSGQAQSQAQIASSFLETFGGGTYDHASWAPANAGSSLTLLTSSTDRDKMDGTNDGGLLVERGVGVTGTYGATRSLGFVTGSDVGASIHVDFSYERPDDSFSNLKPLLFIDGVVVAEGTTISLFSSGEDPGAATGHYSSVRSSLGYFIVADDLGKEMTLTIQYFDGNVSLNRDLVLDAVNVINTGDAIPLPGRALTMTTVQGNPALEFTSIRRISPYRPGLLYTTETSNDLGAWSWLETAPAETVTNPLNADFEEVTERFHIGSSAREFYRVLVRNKRIGDPGITFDATKMDPNYPQMLVWQTAGVQGGIPHRSGYPFLKIIRATDSAGINAAINEVAAQATSIGGGSIILRDGTYTIDEQVIMQDDVRLVGESRNGVVLNITMTTETDPQETSIAIRFDNIENAGLDNMTIQGGHGTPDPTVMDNVKPEFMVTSVNFAHSTNCWIDDVDVLNSGRHTVSSWRSSHVTVRGCLIDGAWNKGGGGNGYFQIQSDRFLVAYNRVRQIRHIALQKEHCEYNVLIHNFFEQDVNFHDDDNGNNLVEGNRSILPTTLASNWHSMMGPWSVVHTISRNDNFLFNNKCEERNNGGIATFSDTGVVYIGSRNYEQDGNVFATTTAEPMAGTFYPVILTH